MLEMWRKERNWHLHRSSCLCVLCKIVIKHLLSWGGGQISSALLLPACTYAVLGFFASGYIISITLNMVAMVRENRFFSRSGFCSFQKILQRNLFLWLHCWYIAQGFALDGQWKLVFGHWKVREMSGNFSFPVSGNRVDERALFKRSWQ